MTDQNTPKATPFGTSSSFQEMMTQQMESLFKTQSDLFRQAVSVQEEWLRRQQEGTQATLAVFKKLAESEDPGKAMQVLTEWMSESVRRLQDDATAIGHRMTDIGLQATRHAEKAGRQAAQVARQAGAQAVETARHYGQQAMTAAQKTGEQMAGAAQKATTQMADAATQATTQMAGAAQHAGTQMAGAARQAGTQMAGAATQAGKHVAGAAQQAASHMADTVSATAMTAGSAVKPAAGAGSTLVNPDGSPLAGSGTTAKPASAESKEEQTKVRRKGPMGSGEVVVPGQNPAGGHHPAPGGSGSGTKPRGG